MIEKQKNPPAYLADVDVAQREDLLGSLLDVLGDGVGEQLVDDSLQVAAGHVVGDDLAHLATHRLDLGVLHVRGLALREGVLQREADAEHTQHVAVGGLHIDVRLDQGLPLADHGPGRRGTGVSFREEKWKFLGYVGHAPQLVRSQLHAVEVGQHILALHLLGDELELAERTLGIGVGLQVAQRHLKHAVLQSLGGDASALSAVHEGLADLAGLEHVRRLHIVPVLAREGVHDLLLRSFLASFRDRLTFADSHVERRH